MVWTLFGQKSLWQSLFGDISIVGDLFGDLFGESLWLSLFGGTLFGDVSLRSLWTISKRSKLNLATKI